MTTPTKPEDYDPEALALAERITEQMNEAHARRKLAGHRVKDLEAIYQDFHNLLFRIGMERRVRIVGGEMVGMTWAEDQERKAAIMAGTKGDENEETDRKKLATEP